ncbi:MAG TPA: hypothetical protein PLA94_16155 [Myxococcota bacterium]|nr:hypothetical protein [Myxococcota bacterium]HND31537.1 hypothetical protein [Myxococcota bacterium]
MWLLGSLALASPCASPVGKVELFAQLEQVGSTEAVQGLLECLNAPLSPEDAARIHLRMATLGTTGAPKSVATAYRLKPQEGWVQVDGRFQEQLPGDRAVVLQWLGEQGEVRATRYWQPGDSLGELEAPPSTPGWQLRLEGALGTVGGRPGATGAGLRLGIGVEGAGRWRPVFRTGYSGMVGGGGGETATLQSGWVLGGLGLRAGKLTLLAGPTWTVAWGRWTVVQGTEQGSSYGPGGRVEAEWALSPALGLCLGGGFWLDGSHNFYDAMLGIAWRAGG